jgi:transcriptional regulator with XRE-family HTH domain
MKKNDFFVKMEEIRSILGLSQRDFAKQMSLNPKQYNDYQRSTREILLSINSVESLLKCENRTVQIAWENWR